MTQNIHDEPRAICFPNYKDDRDYEHPPICYTYYIFEFELKELLTLEIYHKEVGINNEKPSFDELNRALVEIEKEWVNISKKAISQSISLCEKWDKFLLSKKNHSAKDNDEVVAGKGKAEITMYLAYANNYFAALEYKKGNLKSAKEFKDKVMEHCEVLGQLIPKPFSTEDKLSNDLRKYNAALARKEKIAPIKLELVRLLKQEKPVGGWKTKSLAAKELAPMLVSYGNESKLKVRVLTLSNAPKTIRSWLNEDEICKVFEDTQNFEATKSNSK